MLLRLWSLARSFRSAPASSAGPAQTPPAHASSTPPGSARPGLLGGRQGLSPGVCSKTHTQPTKRTERLQRAQRWPGHRAQGTGQDEPRPHPATRTHTERARHAHAADATGLPGDPVREFGRCRVTVGEQSERGSVPGWGGCVPWASTRVCPVLHKVSLQNVWPTLQTYHDSVTTRVVGTAGEKPARRRKHHGSRASTK